MGFKIYVKTSQNDIDLYQVITSLEKRTAWGATRRNDKELLCRYSSGTYTTTEQNYHMNEKAITMNDNKTAISFMKGKIVDSLPIFCLYLFYRRHWSADSFTRELCRKEAWLRLKIYDIADETDDKSLPDFKNYLDMEIRMPMARIFWKNSESIWMEKMNYPLFLNSIFLKSQKDKRSIDFFK